MEGWFSGFFVGVSVGICVTVRWGRRDVNNGRSNQMPEDKERKYVRRRFVHSYNHLGEGSDKLVVTLVAVSLLSLFNSISLFLMSL